MVGIIAETSKARSTARQDSCDMVHSPSAASHPTCSFWAVNRTAVMTVGRRELPMARH